MKKRPFVLFELLIAFSLVSFSMLPFLHYPFKHMKKEIDTLFSMQLQRQAENDLALLQEQLFCKKIDEELLFAEGPPLEFSGETTLYLPCKMQRTYPKKTKIFVEKLKLSNEREFSALVHFKISYIDPSDKRKNALVAKREMIAKKKI